MTMATSVSQKRAWEDRFTKPVSKHATARAKRAIAKKTKTKKRRKLS